MIVQRGKSDPEVRWLGANVSKGTYMFIRWKKVHQMYRNLKSMSCSYLERIYVFECYCPLSPWKR